MHQDHFLLRKTPQESALLEEAMGFFFLGKPQGIWKERNIIYSFKYSSKLLDKVVGKYQWVFLIWLELRSLQEIPSQT